MFSYEFGIVSKNTFSYRTPLVAASVCTSLGQKCKLPKNGSPGEIWTGFRSSRSQIFFEIGVIKNFANSTGRHLCWRHFLKMLQSWRLYLRDNSTQMFSCEISKIFKDTNYYRTAPVAVSDILVFSKDPGTKTGATFCNKYQIQLPQNQYRNEGNHSWIFLSFFLSVLSFFNFAMTKWFCRNM